MNLICDSILVYLITIKYQCNGIMKKIAKIIQCTRIQPGMDLGLEWISWGGP